MWEGFRTSQAKSACNREDVKLALEVNVKQYLLDHHTSGNTLPYSTGGPCGFHFGYRAASPTKGLIKGDTEPTRLDLGTSSRAHETSWRPSRWPRRIAEMHLSHAKLAFGKQMLQKLQQQMTAVKRWKILAALAFHRKPSDCQAAIHQKGLWPRPLPNLLAATHGQTQVIVPQSCKLEDDRSAIIAEGSSLASGHKRSASQKVEVSPQVFPSASRPNFSRSPDTEPSAPSAGCGAHHGCAPGLHEGRGTGFPPPGQKRRHNRAPPKGANWKYQ